MAKFADLPAELLYEFVAEVVSEYVDRAVTCEPIALQEEAAAVIDRPQQVVSADGSNPDGAMSTDPPDDDWDDEEDEDTDDPYYDPWDKSPQAKRRRAFRKWQKKDREEKLHQATLGPFGVKRNVAGSLRHSPWSIIWRMRRHYRIARSEPFESRHMKTDQRTHNANFYDADTHEKFEATRLDIWAVMFGHQDCVEAIAHPVLRRRIERRAYASVLAGECFQHWEIDSILALNVVLDGYLLTAGQWVKFAKQSDNFLLIFEELERKQKCNYDEVDYPGLPGPVVEAVGIRQVFRDTLEIVASLPRCGPENGDVTKAVKIVKRVAPRWDELAKTSFYVDVL
ncbi:unnamed protein product [Cyclocybe aegerita]|uniref:Uncharacterized protein n=1 Tax=Cyclocybe aegerita TaxID=1973307 RepID=A0A8S0WLG0_CYCAE|nr:unnamed protein product [Cyclocybe aegerita]